MKKDRDGMVMWAMMQAAMTANNTTPDLRSSTRPYLGQSIGGLFRLPSGFLLLRASLWLGVFFIIDLYIFNYAIVITNGIFI